VTKVPLLPWKAEATRLEQALKTWQKELGDNPAAKKVEKLIAESGAFLRKMTCGPERGTADHPPRLRSTSTFDRWMSSRSAGRRICKST